MSSFPRTFIVSPSSGICLSHVASPGLIHSCCLLHASIQNLVLTWNRNSVKLGVRNREPILEIHCWTFKLLFPYSWNESKNAYITGMWKLREWVREWVNKYLVRQGACSVYSLLFYFFIFHSPEKYTYFFSDYPEGHWLPGVLCWHPQVCIIDLGPKMLASNPAFLTISGVTLISFLHFILSIYCPDTL